ncbi:unnamed protein product [Trichogramma brassicae]|uniref:Uncharacterized protein n=1 Tax=Trichogramma brassicae TaxID=86971 RepID=A0A6H5IN25_9HYME|nr:unnamed protein product [Trichogramma brassicae]
MSIAMHRSRGVQGADQDARPVHAAGRAQAGGVALRQPERARHPDPGQHGPADDHQRPGGARVDQHGDQERPEIDRLGPRGPRGYDLYPFYLNLENNSLTVRVLEKTRVLESSRIVLGSSSSIRVKLEISGTRIVLIIVPHQLVMSVYCGGCVAFQLIERRAVLRFTLCIIYIII